METVRFVLVIIFVMLTMKLYTTWQATYPPVESVQQSEIPSTPPGQQTTPAIRGEVPDLAALPESSTPEQAQTVQTSGPAPVEIETDIFRISINPVGAGIEQAALLDFPVDLQHPDDPFVLMEQSAEQFFISQGGVLSKQEGPTHEAQYRTAAQNYKMAAGEDELLVPFTWSANGLTVTKTYRFVRGSHLVTINYMISNNTGEQWTGRTYQQIKRNDPEKSTMRFIYTYTGTVISEPENRYTKIAFDDIDDAPLAKDITNGWIAVIQHYFLTALVPTDKDAQYHFYTRSLGNKLYTSGLVSPSMVIEPGQRIETSQSIYIGPKDQDRLAEIAEGLDLTVDYGMLWFLAKPLFWLLSEIHEIVGNWGWSIILVTVLLKLMFYKLSAAGYRSMARMRQVQPRLVSLKERYKDDRVKMNQAMMQIYKEEKINPFGGCFPIVVQIPVFIALYWVLLESVELRQAGFILWINDLSTPDPYWVLPLIMGITMFLQQKLNPAPIDPVQAKVMMVLPVVFTVFFGFFPSGLVLYWVANNTLSILQQWKIMRNLEKAGLGHKKK